MRHPRHVFIGIRIAEDTVLIAVKCDRTIVLKQIALQGFKVAERVLRRHEPQFHQRAGRVVDEDEQGAGIPPILEPSMIRTVDLDQFAEALPA